MQIYNTQYTKNKCNMSAERKGHGILRHTLSYFYFVIFSNFYILFDVDFTGIQQKG